MVELLQKYRCKQELFFEEDKGQYYIEIPVIQNLGDYSNESVMFLLDTGAYITVLSENTAVALGFDKLPSVIDRFHLAGFAGACTASLKEIPGMIIGDRTLKGVKVAIPHEDTKYSILGMNVLEHFKFFVDTENTLIYFADNPKYKLPQEIKCAEVLFHGSP